MLSRLGPAMDWKLESPVDAVNGECIHNGDRPASVRNQLL